MISQPSLGELCDRAPRAELRVVGVRYHHHYPLDPVLSSCLEGERLLRTPCARSTRVHRIPDLEGARAPRLFAVQQCRSGSCSSIRGFAREAPCYNPRACRAREGGEPESGASSSLSTRAPWPSSAYASRSISARSRVGGVSVLWWYAFVVAPALGGADHGGPPASGEALSPLGACRRLGEPRSPHVAGHERRGGRSERSPARAPRRAGRLRSPRGTRRPMIPGPACRSR